MANYGRHRQSIVDIENELHNIFNQHPDSHANDSGVPVIPADALVDVFRSFSDVCNGVELLSNEEMSMLKALLTANPGLEVTPQILLQFIAEKTKGSPPHTPDADEEEQGYSHRGREDESDRQGAHSRSSSNDSDYTSHYPSSRPPSRGPQTPGHGGKSSVFDAERRQRSTPLQNNNAPSSWAKRPTPAHRRKSDAGSRSDSESWSTSPSAFGSRPSGRTRTPSNPTSPSSTLEDLHTFSPIGSPTFNQPSSRPHSRAHSQPQSAFSLNGNFYRDEHGYSSPEENNHTIHSSANKSFNKSFKDTRHAHEDDDSFSHISSLRMPRPSGDSDSEGEEDSLGLVMDRAMASSTASMEPQERLEALQRVNTELGRKLMEAERTLQNKLSEHELELEEMQGRLEELRSELNSTKREEKELRSKERQNMTQIAALEVEVAKVTKALEHARTTYSSLQRQYQEQCAVSEKYRVDLRQREEVIRSLKESASIHELEIGKWAREHEAYESRIAALEKELLDANSAHGQLDDQKQENLLLKETIDRMRFDMDELRNNAAAAGGSGVASSANTLSKSLGAELQTALFEEQKAKAAATSQADEPEEEEEMEEEEEEGSERSDEDVYETIIRRRHKVPSRANKSEARHTTFEEVKEYSDSTTQYEPELFCVSHASQTDPEPKILKASFSVQTTQPRVQVTSVQTEPETKPLPRVTVEMNIQTDEEVVVEREEISRSPSPQHDESLASSSSTILPPTPKAQPQLLPNTPIDQPPAYNQIHSQSEEEHNLRIAADALKKYHNGVHIPFQAIEGGIAPETVEDWKALKEELGVDCLVIDKIIETSKINTGNASSSRVPKDGKSSRKSRFYNIYNTYIYGDKGGNGAATFPAIASQAVMLVGASALVMLAVSPYMAPQYNVPGGPSYYDRSAWSSFNSMQAAGEGFGFAPDGTAAVWSFLGRVGDGAARIARGWPT